MKDGWRVISLFLRKKLHNFWHLSLSHNLFVYKFFLRNCCSPHACALCERARAITRFRYSAFQLILFTFPKNLRSIRKFQLSMIRSTKKETETRNFNSQNVVDSKNGCDGLKARQVNYLNKWMYQYQAKKIWIVNIEIIIFSFLLVITYT